MSAENSSEKVERAVLAAVWADPGFLGRCLEAGLDGDAFAGRATRLMWEATLAAHYRGLEVDELTVEEQLAAGGTLEEAGGREGVNAVSLTVTSTAFAGSWLEQLVDLWKRRRATRAAARLGEATREAAESFEEVQERMTPILTELSGLSNETKHETTAEVFERSITHFDAWLDGDEGKIDRSREIVWGIPGLDERLGSFNPVMSDFLILLGGDSSWGKSSLARQVARNNLEKGKRVVIFLLETSTFSWPAQAAAQRSQVNLRADPLALREEAGGPQKIERFRAEMRRAKEWAEKEQLFVFENAVTAEQIAARTRMIAARTGSVDLIVVDYLQEMRSPDRKLRGDQALHDNCRELKALAKDCRCPCLLLSSINTDYNKEYGPGKWDFRGSRDITYAADQAYMIFRPEKDANGVEQSELTKSGDPRKVFQQLLNRVKGRDAGTGAVWLTFQPRYTLFWGLPDKDKRGRKPHAPELAEAEEW